MENLNKRDPKTNKNSNGVDEKLRTLIDYTYDWLYWIAPDGHFIYNSPSCERMTGYRPDEFVNNSTLLSTIIYPDDQKFVQNHFQIIDSSGPHSFDFRIYTRSGEIRWIAHACQAVFDEDGKWLGRCGNNRDITERKQVEEAAKIEERRLRSELNISNLKATSLKELLDYALEEAIALSDSKIGYIYYYNEEKQEFTLHAWSKAVMAECTIPNPPTVYQLVKTGIWGEVVRQRKPLLINDFLAPNPLKKGYPKEHNKLYRFMSLPIFSDGRIVAVVGVANKEKQYTEQDLQQLTQLMGSIWKIAERKQAEEELRKYQDNLENLVNSRTSELEARNRELAAEVVERKRAEAEIRSIAKFPEENPDPIFRLNLDRIILYSNPVGKRLLKIWGIEVGKVLPQVVSHRLGEERNLAKPLTIEIPVDDQIYSFEVVPIEAMGYINIYGRNITKRKIAEQLSQQYIAEIKRSNQELDRFAYVISHDLQAPLRSIIGFIQLLEKDYAAKLDATAQEYIKTVVESGRRLQTMIVDILNFARLKANKEEMIAVDCETLLAEILGDLKFTIQDSKAVITHDKLPSVVGVRALLTQVFTNLIDNALKFHGPNPPQIHVSARETETEVVFSVKDNGIGFDLKHNERIFQLFGRLHTEKEYAGHGIGLSTCKKIINLHGGKIWAESKIGAGSTFYFTIPKKPI